MKVSLTLIIFYLFNVYLFLGKRERPKTSKLIGQFNFNEKKDRQETITSKTSSIFNDESISKKSISEQDEYTSSTKSIKDSKCYLFST